MEMNNNGELLIYFYDLSDIAQKELLEFYNVKSEKELNFDLNLNPLTIHNPPEF